MPGDLLLLMDCIAVCMSSMIGGSSFSSNSAAVWFVWVLSKELLCSAAAVVNRCWK